MHEQSLESFQVFPCELPVWGFAVWAASVRFSVGCQLGVLQYIGRQFGVLPYGLPDLGFAVWAASVGIYYNVGCQFGVLQCPLLVLGFAVPAVSFGVAFAFTVFDRYNVWGQHWFDTRSGATRFGVFSVTTNTSSSFSSPIRGYR